MANEWYVISTSVANLAALTAAGASDLSIQPHPNEFIEAAEMVGFSGTGLPVELGFAQATWTYDVPLSPAEWKELMDFTGAAAYATVYIRTRTNQIQAANDYYQYKNYSAIMMRPTGTSRAKYRYEDVRVEFRRLVEI